MTATLSFEGRLGTGLRVAVLCLPLGFATMGWHQAQAQPAVVQAAKPGPIAHDWFKHGDGVHAAWHVTPNPANPLEVSITPRYAAKDQPRRKVLVLYPRPSSAYDVAITKILSVFESKALPVELAIVNFQNETARGQASLKKAHDENVDLILAMGSESAAWLWDHYRGGKLPVVTVCAKDPVLLGQSASYDEATGTNFAFTSLNVPIDVQMAYVAQLKPNLKTIAVISDSTNTSAIETQVKPMVDYGNAHGLTILDLAVKDARNAKAELAQLVESARAKMAEVDPDLGSSIFWITGSTAVFREITTINAHAGRAAVLSVVPDVVQAGDDSAMLSIGISFESNAQLAALYATDVLTGRARIGALKVGVVSPPDIAINFRKLRQIGATVPLSVFSAAGTIYDYDGRLARAEGKGAVASEK
jgi:putative ABC transport system substrate-binding protein